MEHAVGVEVVNGKKQLSQPFAYLLEMGRGKKKEDVCTGSV